MKRHCEPVRTLAWQSRESSESLDRGGRRCPPDLRPHSFLSLLRERKESPRRQKKPAPFRVRRGGENSIFAAFFFLSESRPLRWVAFRLILEKKENFRNWERSSCRHRVRRSLLHSASAGAAKTPHPQPSSSFPNCDRFTGSQFGHLEFYNAARDLDDGGHLTSYGYVTSCRGGRPCPPASPIFSYIISFAKNHPPLRAGGHVQNSLTASFCTSSFKNAGSSKTSSAASAFSPSAAIISPQRSRP